MGTNYYWHEKAPCVTCGRPHPDKHIGKSSCGWCFSLHVYPEEGITDLPDWERLWATPGSCIYDEYGTAVSVEEMRKEITERGRDGSPEELWERRPTGYASWQEFHAMNCSKPGPRGLLRHGYSNNVKHGDGTWDCCVGDFS